MSTDGMDTDPAKPAGKNTWYAKNRPKFTITPTTAAVIAVRGAVKPNLPCVDSINGPPIRMNRKDGKKVNQVAMHAATAPLQKAKSGPRVS